MKIETNILSNEELEDEQDTSSSSLWISFSQGEEIKDGALEDVKKETQPKPRFKEATFIKELQKREIGRPSTYAGIVETVLSPTRGYCVLDTKTKFMTPTDKGIALIEFLDRSFSNIISIEWTKNMEAGLDKIANGKLKKIDFLNEFYSTLESTIKNNKETSTMASEESPACPLCGGKMVVRRSRYGKLFHGCCSYPKCTGIVNIK